MNKFPTHVIVVEVSSSATSQELLEVVLRGLRKGQVEHVRTTVALVAQGIESR